MRLLATHRRLLAALPLLLLTSVASAQNTQVHTTSTVSFTVFNNGIVGAGPEPSGGFIYSGTNGLYEGQLLVGQSPSQVSGQPYSLAGIGLPHEWMPVGSVDPISAPAPFDTGYQAQFTDASAPNPIGIAVTQRSYSSDAAALADFVVVEYEITNTSGAPLSGIYVGLFNDFDVNDVSPNYTQNLADYNSATRLLYAWHAPGTIPEYVGVAALGNAPVSGVAFDFSGTGGTDVDAFAALTTIATPPTVQDDRRTVLGVGPFNIPAGESITVPFAYVGGDNQADIIANAAAAHAATSGPLDEAIHDTGVVQFEVFDNGELGSYYDGVSGTIGEGFVFDGQNGLFEATVLVGVSPSQVSGDAYEFPNLEWETTSPLSVAPPPAGFNEAYRASYDDSAASNPIGVEVTQTSFSNTGDPYVIVALTIENTTSTAIQNAYVGIFADWDVSASATNDLADYDAGSQLLYAWNNGAGNTNYYGVAALDGNVSGVSYDALPGDVSLFAGLSTIASAPTAPADRRTVIGVGPFNLPAGASGTRHFAFVGGENEADIIANAIAARNAIGVANEPPTVVNGLRLGAPYPNPSRGTTAVAFSLEEPQAVRVVAYDALGRRVATLADGPHAAGEHTVTWEAQGLPSGVYVVRLEAASASLSRSFIIAR